MYPSGSFLGGYLLPCVAPRILAIFGSRFGSRERPGRPTWIYYTTQDRFAPWG